MQAQKHKLIQAVKQLDFRLTAADAAARLGIGLAAAKVELNKLAWETQGVLEVTKTGDILYCFEKTFEADFEVCEWKEALKQIWSAIYQFLFYMLRVSFGVLLIASFLTITVVFAAALLFILFGMDAADGELDDLEADLDMDYFDFADIGLFFAWSVFTGAKTPDSYTDRYLGMKIDTGDKGFFFNCYSFLFGDGNPNCELEEKQWQYVAELIRRCSGVVTAEQIAPYVLSVKPGSSQALAALVRFDGVPEVTESGNIVYVFPQLQVTAHHRIRFDLPDYLEESPWKFSDLPANRLHWVFFFAGANLCGAYALNNHLSWFAPLVPFAAQVHLIMVYACFFMGFPILRQLVNTCRNAMIDYRNGKRLQNWKFLEDKVNQAKLVEAQNYSQRKFVIAQQDIVFSSGRDSLEQQFDGMPQAGALSRPE